MRKETMENSLMKLDDDDETALLFRVSAPGMVYLHGEHANIGLAGSVELRTQLTFHVLKPGLDKGKIMLDLKCLDINHTYNVPDVIKLLLTEAPPLVDGANPSLFNLERPEFLDVEKVEQRVDAFLRKVYGQTSLSSSQYAILSALLVIFTGMMSSVRAEIQRIIIKLDFPNPTWSKFTTIGSYAVCFAGALLHYIRLHSLSDVSKKGFKSFRFSNLDFSCFNAYDRDMIACWAALSDKALETQYPSVERLISTYGSIIFFKKIFSQAKPKVTLLSNTSFVNILLVHTGKGANYVERAEYITSTRDLYLYIIDHIIDAIDGVSITAVNNYKKLAWLAQDEAVLPDDPEISNSLSELGELIDMNHALLQSLGVIHSTIEDVCNIAQQYGLHAKMTGSWGGGYAYILLPQPSNAVNVSEIREKLSSRCYESKLVTLGGIGVTLEEIVDEREEDVEEMDEAAALSFFGQCAN